MSGSNRGVASPLVIEAPDPYFNSSLRKKANLMRMSRSPGKPRRSVDQDVGLKAHLVSGEPPVNAPPQSSRSSASDKDAKPSFATAQSSTPSMSNRSTVFRKHSTGHISSMNTQTHIDEDESSEFFLEESTHTQGSTHQRIVSHGPAGELQFSPAVPHLSVTAPVSANHTQAPYANKFNGNFQNRFRNAALAAHTNPQSIAAKTGEASKSVGISWDTIIDNVNSKNCLTPFDHPGKTQKHGDYERFDDSSSVGTDIHKGHTRTMSDFSGLNRKDLVHKARIHAVAASMEHPIMSGLKPVNMGKALKDASDKSPLDPNINRRTIPSTQSSTTTVHHEMTHADSTRTRILNLSKDMSTGNQNVQSSLSSSFNNFATNQNHRSTWNNTNQHSPARSASRNTMDSMGMIGVKQSVQRWNASSESKNKKSNASNNIMGPRHDIVDLDDTPFHDEKVYSLKQSEINTTHRDSSQLKRSTFTFNHEETNIHRETPLIISKKSSLSEDDLNRNNNRYSSSTLPIPANNIKGFRGFIDKTKGTPALADYDSDSVVTASTSELLGYRNESIQGIESLRHQQKATTGYDMYPGTSNHSRTMPISDSQLQPSIQHVTHSNQDSLNFARIGNSLSAIVTTPEAFQQRMMNQETFSDSESLWDKRNHRTDLAYDGDVPDFGKNNDDIPSSHSDLTAYAVDPLQVQAFVRKYRKISDSLVERGHDPVLQEDAKKAFALFEMRSRIMETDIERGIGRCGGTTIVDDMVITEFYKQMYRVRDAVIVSKAWRDGASPKDAFTAMTLTRKAITFSMRKPRRNRSPKNNTNPGKNSFFWVWEDVLWVDDTDFTLLRCPSLGPKSMRGSEIFTIGDCQSILLKITHERCEQLRNELNQAAALQLDAKEMMKEEAEFNDLLGVEGMMTDVEIRYITTTEQVKSISKQLVLAEKAFTMVKERVERLVQKYENILEKIDQDGEARGVDMEDEDEVCLSEDEVDERGRLERRAERAELRAELSAREAQMLSLTVEKTKQEAENIRREKEEEIIELQQRLDDLEKKSAFLAREYESKLSLKILDKAKHMVAQNEQKAMSVHSLDEEASAAKERIKARFRNRSAHKGNTVAQNQQRDSSETPRPSRNSFHQRLEFYERSLRSIEQT